MQNKPTETLTSISISTALSDVPAVTTMRFSKLPSPTMKRRPTSEDETAASLS
jgi:hypothetical protein